MTKLEHINSEFKSLLWDLDLTDDQAKKISELQKYVNQVINRYEHFYCSSSPENGGVKSCNVQCKGCSNLENSNKLVNKS